MTSKANACGIWTCEQGQIRVTDQGQPSVFDMIRVLGGQKAPHKAWERLTESHPEVLTKCQHLLFPGPGQRQTPVARTKEDAYYILGLLPGAVGRRYREQAAKLFTAFLENPAALANELVDRLTKEQQEWLEARLRGMRTRDDFTLILKEMGVTGYGYGNCTNAVYIPVLGTDARGLKLRIAQDKHLPVKAVNPRDHFTVQQLGDVETAERIASGQLRRTKVYGNPGVERVVRRSAEYTRQLLDGAIDIPGIA
jgi:hypothetical protein